MFGLGKQKNDVLQSQSSAGSQAFSINSIHTMEDDLNVSGGIVSSSKENEAVPQDNNNLQNRKVEDFQRPGVKKTFSPFLNQQANEANFNPDASAYQSQNETQQATLPPPQKKANNGLKSSKILIVGTAVMAFLALAAGGYYFWISRQTPPENPSVVVDDNEPVAPPVEPPIIIEPQPQKYSLVKPNYLVIDSENSNQQNVKSLIMTASENIKELNPESPVEFIPVDASNNPISFSTFSLMTGLNLVPVTENLEDAFSLFIYPDMGNTKLGLAINLKDKQRAITSMSAKEKTLPQDLSFLFLDTVLPITGDRSFNSFVNPKYTIRYINLDSLSDGSISIDYAFTDQLLIIASSKNTMVNLMNKISQTGY